MTIAGRASQARQASKVFCLTLHLHCEGRSRGMEWGREASPEVTGAGHGVGEQGGLAGAGPVERKGYYFFHPEGLNSGCQA